MPGQRHLLVGIWGWHESCCGSSSTLGSSTLGEDLSMRRCASVWSRTLRKCLLYGLAVAGLIVVFPTRDNAQAVGGRPLITRTIDENQLVTLVGNTRPEANAAKDLGPVEGDLHLDMY